jgi:hypothetical protein
MVDGIRNVLVVVGTVADFVDAVDMYTSYVTVEAKSSDSS